MNLHRTALYPFVLAVWLVCGGVAQAVANEPAPGQPADDAKAESADPDASDSELTKSGAAKSSAAKSDAAKSNETEQPADRDAAAPKRRPNSSSLDADLLKSLGVTQNKDAAKDPLREAIERMRSVQSRIGNKDAGARTQEDQARIVKDLEQLIEQLQQQSNSGKPPPKQDSQPQPENEEPTEQAQSQPENSAKQQAARRKQENSKAAESTDRTEPGKPVTIEEARREELEKDVWGHLPPALRKQLLNVYSDKFLPKYEDLVRSYYETLAERGRKGQR